MDEGKEGGRESIEPSGGHFFLKERKGDLLAWLSKVVEE